MSSSGTSAFKLRLPKWISMLAQPKQSAAAYQEILDAINALRDNAKSWAALVICYEATKIFNASNVELLMKLFLHLKRNILKDHHQFLSYLHNVVIKCEVSLIGKILPLLLDDYKTLKEYEMLSKTGRQIVYSFYEKGIKGSTEVNSAVQMLEKAISKFVDTPAVFNENLAYCFEPPKQVFLFISLNQGGEELLPLFRIVMRGLNATYPAEKLIRYTGKITQLTKNAPELRETEFEWIERISALFSSDTAVTKSCHMLDAFYRWFYAKSPAKRPHLTLLVNETTVMSTQTPFPLTVIEAALVISDNIRERCDSLSNIDADLALTICKFISSLMAIVLACDSDTDRGYCRSCQHTRRHVIDRLGTVQLALYNRVAKEGGLTRKLVKYIVSMVSYKMQILDALRCSERAEMGKQAMIQIYNAMIRLDPIVYGEETAELLKTFKKYEETFPHQLEESRVLHLNQLGCGNDPRKVLNLYCIRVLMSPVNCAAEALQIIDEREKDSSLKGKTFYELVTRPDFDAQGFTLPKFNEEQLLWTEMEVLFRYRTNPIRLKLLFDKLIQTTKDAKLLAKALFVLDPQEREQLSNTTIEQVLVPAFQSARDCFWSHLGLGLCQLRRYFVLFNTLKSRMRQVRINETKMTEISHIFDEFHVEKERLDVRMLEQAVRHLQAFVERLMGEKAELEQFPSSRRFVKILETISMQFTLRNCSRRALAVEEVAFRFAKVQKIDWALVRALELAVREELCDPETAIGEYWPLVETQIGAIETLNRAKRAYLLQCMISVAIYRIERGRVEEGLELLRRVDGLYKEMLAKDPDDKDYFKVQRARFYFAHFRIMLLRPELAPVSPSLFACKALVTLRDLKDFNCEFSVQVPQMLFEIVKEWVSYLSLVQDTARGIAYLYMVLKYMVALGLASKTAQAYAMIVHIELNQEKLVEVETKLEHMDKMLVFESPKLSPIVVSPKKKVFAPIAFAATQEMDAVRRDASERRESPRFLLPSPPTDLPKEELCKYLVQHRNCGCLSCKNPEVCFLGFRLGALYARFLYMHGKYEVCETFYKEAMDFFPFFEAKLRTEGSSQQIKELREFSFQVLMHYVHCLRRSGKMEAAKELLVHGEALSVENPILGAELAYMRDLFELESVLKAPQRKEFVRDVPLATPQVKRSQSRPAKTAIKVPKATESRICQSERKKKAPAVTIFVDSPKTKSPPKTETKTRRLPTTSATSTAKTTRNRKEPAAAAATKPTKKVLKFSPASPADTIDPIAATPTTSRVTKTPKSTRRGTSKKPSEASSTSPVASSSVIDLSDSSSIIDASITTTHEAKPVQTLSSRRNLRRAAASAKKQTNS